MCYNLTMCYTCSSVLQSNDVLHMQQQRFCCLASLTVGGTQQSAHWETHQTPVCRLTIIVKIKFDNNISILYVSLVVQADICSGDRFVQFCRDQLDKLEQ